MVDQKHSSGWQPIATAPKDGNDIIISGGTYSCEQLPCEFHDQPFSMSVAIAWYDVDDDTWNSDGYYFYKPTHWQPLPKAIGKIK